jgi:uncharacterized protein
MPRKPVLRPLDIFLILVIGLLAGALLGTTLNTVRSAAQPSDGYIVKMPVPAVDEKGNGVATNLVVEARKGSGRTLANIDVLLFWVDTQQSIQTARSVAESIAGVSTINTDLVYSVAAKNVSLIGGPSAGAALTVATIGVLEGKQPKPGVMMTGTIEDNQTIGPVGGVLEKARAAKSVGISNFLVPKGESKETITEPVQNCTKQAGYVYCERSYVQNTVDIGSVVGLDVVEVGSINDALPYFFS